MRPSLPQGLFVRADGQSCALVYPGVLLHKLRVGVRVPHRAHREVRKFGARLHDADHNALRRVAVAHDILAHDTDCVAYKLRISDGGDVLAPEFVVGDQHCIRRPCRKVETATDGHRQRAHPPFDSPEKRALKGLPARRAYRVRVHLCTVGHVLGGQRVLRFRGRIARRAEARGVGQRRAYGVCRKRVRQCPFLGGFRRRKPRQPRDDILGARARHPACGG